jgi:hypothetical protein
VDIYLEPVLVEPELGRARFTTVRSSRDHLALVPRVQSTENRGPEDRSLEQGNAYTVRTLVEAPFSSSLRSLRGVGPPEQSSTLVLQP